MLFSGLLAVALMLQGESRARPALPDAKVNMRATAIRTAAAPAIDGLDTDPVWRNAVAFGDFVEFTPREGNRPRFQTEFRVAYDEKNFYVFVRAFDDEPAQIKTALSRRDVRPPTDQIKIIIDSYFDRRSGYEFAVNPGGVKRDFIIYNDNQEDGAWDAVWDVSTSIDSLGWTAEFKISALAAPLPDCSDPYLRLRRLARHRPPQGTGELAGVSRDPGGHLIAAG